MCRIWKLDLACIWTIHQSCGHPGIKRTHYVVKLVSPEVSKAAVQEVVRECEECQSIDPAGRQTRHARTEGGLELI